MSWDLSSLLLREPDVIFEPEGRVVAEIGFGNGEFTAHLARTMPDTTVVGFEISQWCVTKAARRLLAEGLTNARLVAGDARYLLSRTLRPSTLDAIYMNFPCPWPKKRHAERRVTSDGFAELLELMLARGGAFRLATDVDWYADETAAMLAARGTFDVSRPDAVGRQAMTKYERKWHAMGRTTYEVEAIKRGGGAGMTEHDEMTDEVAAPAVRATWSEALASMRAMQGEELSGDGWNVVYKEVYTAAAEVALMLVITVDDGFEQHFYIKAATSAGAVRGKVDAVGRPYRTPAVREAIRTLASRAGIVF